MPAWRRKLSQMISTLEIRNFKSIKQLKLDCRRINILIGEPNTGKSNILETLGIFSFVAYYAGDDFRDFVRYERMSNLFYDENLDEPILIQPNNISLTFRFDRGRFEGRIYNKDGQLAELSGDYNNLDIIDVRRGELYPFKSY
ncbi:MAG: AAA family ATPase, partial [Dehalococcoidales bacterium]|nr:AAA family ATPase [Dehalococcoidales bacterium]